MMYGDKGGAEARCMFVLNMVSTSNANIDSRSFFFFMFFSSLSSMFLSPCSVVGVMLSKFV